MVALKDKDNITQKGGVTYRIKCDQVDCKKEYIWKSVKTFGEKLKEHLRTPFPIYDQSNLSCHYISVDNFSVKRLCLDMMTMPDACLVLLYSNVL